MQVYFSSGYNAFFVGIIPIDTVATYLGSNYNYISYFGTAYGYSYNNGGSKYNYNSFTYGSSWSYSVMRWTLISGSLTFYVNGVSQGVAFSGLGSTLFYGGISWVPYTPSPNVATLQSYTCYPPTGVPTAIPTYTPTFLPTRLPTSLPTSMPTIVPTYNPTFVPTYTPSYHPTRVPSDSPTVVPSKIPTDNPTRQPTPAPTRIPTKLPSSAPTRQPSPAPTHPPSLVPTLNPTKQPTPSPTRVPTYHPTKLPSNAPSIFPTSVPTSNPTKYLEGIYQIKYTCSITTVKYTYLDYLANPPLLVNISDTLKLAFENQIQYTALAQSFDDLSEMFSVAIYNFGQDENDVKTVNFQVRMLVDDTDLYNLLLDQESNLDSIDAYTQVHLRKNFNDNTLTVLIGTLGGGIVTSVPTIQPTNQPITPEKLSGGGVSNDTSSVLDPNSNMFYILIIIIILFLVMILVIIYLYRKKNKNKQKLLTNVEMLQKVTSISTIGIPTDTNFDEKSLEGDEKDLFNFLKANKLHHYFPHLQQNNMSIPILMIASKEILDEMCTKDLEMNSFEKLRFQNGIEVLRIKQQDIQQVGFDSNTGVQEAEPDDPDNPNPNPGNNENYDNYGMNYQNYDMHQYNEPMEQPVRSNAMPPPFKLPPVPMLANNQKQRYDSDAFGDDAGEGLGGQVTGGDNYGNMDYAFADDEYQQ